MIQAYSDENVNDDYTLDSVIHMKAWDDRVGSIAHIYAVAELVKRGIPGKVILAGDEEGLNKDIAWARLIRPAFRQYVRPDGLILICDGFDGKHLKDEFNSGDYLSKALITGYISDASGAGDPGLLSIFRDKIIEMALTAEFEVAITTSYASRSIDPKIMDEFPLIGFIDWSNGIVGGADSACHVDESVKLRQVVNVIGVTCLVVKYFSEVLMR